MIEFTVYGKPEPGGSKKAFLPISKATLSILSRSTYVTEGGLRTLLRPVVVDANQKVKAWKSLVALRGTEAAEKQNIGLLEGPLHVEFVFALTRPKTVKRLEPTVKPDITKLIRAAEDALTGVIWKDDAQIVRQIASKVYVEGEPYCRVIVTQWEETS